MLIAKELGKYPHEIIEEMSLQEIQFSIAALCELSKKGVFM